jgi:hypothetical protein
VCPPLGLASLSSFVSRHYALYHESNWNQDNVRAILRLSLQAVLAMVLQACRALARLLVLVPAPLLHMESRGRRQLTLPGHTELATIYPSICVANTPWTVLRGEFSVAYSTISGHNTEELHHGRVTATGMLRNIACPSHQRVPHLPRLSTSVTKYTVVSISTTGINSAHHCHIDDNNFKVLIRPLFNILRSLRNIRPNTEYISMRSLSCLHTHTSTTAFGII